jgi:putative ABC transport system substrate-binding protein
MRRCGEGRGRLLSRRAFIGIAGLASVSWPRAAFPQPSGKMPRVGVLTVLPLSSMALPRQFPEALRELGYVDGRNILIEWRSADGRAEHLAGLAADLVRAKTDVIVAVSNPDIRAAKQATTKIPILMVAANDPVDEGLVASLARPGGNVTGRTWTSAETVAKQLEVLKETTPAATRILYVVGDDERLAVTRGLAAGTRALGLTLREVRVGEADDVARLLDGVRPWRPEALYVSPVFSAGRRDAILRFAAQQRLPAMYSNRGIVEAGGLMTYAPSALEAAQRTAHYVDRILKGARAADLPVEQPQKFDLLINLKSAKEIGLTIPRSILLRAEVIE